MGYDRSFMNHVKDHPNATHATWFFESRSAGGGFCVRVLSFVLCIAVPSRPSFFLRVLGVHAVALFLSVATAAAQPYPTKPIRIIALSSPASGPDIIGRLIGSKFTEAWGQQVIVDTRDRKSAV